MSVAHREPLETVEKPLVRIATREQVDVQEMFVTGVARMRSGPFEE